MAGLVDDIVAGLGGRRSRARWSSGLHARVRYVLWTYIDEIAPVPFGADHDTWAQWRSTAIAATMSMITTAEDLYDGEIPAGGERVFITGDVPAVSDEEPPESEVLPDGGAEGGDDEPEDGDIDDSEGEADEEGGESDDEDDNEDEKPARKSRSSADDTAAVLEAMAADDDDDDDDADDFDNYFD